MNYKIVPLTQDLINESFYITNSNLQEIGRSIIETQKLWSSQNKNPDYVRLVAIEGDNNVIGSIACLFEQKIIMSHAIWGHLEDVVVRKGYQGMGIGRALVHEITQISKKRGGSALRLSSADHNLAFYEKCGFQRKSNSMQLKLDE